MEISIELSQSILFCLSFLLHREVFYHEYNVVSQQLWAAALNIKVQLVVFCRCWKVVLSSDHTDHNILITYVHLSVWPQPYLITLLIQFVQSLASATRTILCLTINYSGKAPLVGKHQGLCMLSFKFNRQTLWKQQPRNLKTSNLYLYGVSHMHNI